MRYRTQVIIMAEPERRREEVLNPLPTPPHSNPWGFSYYLSDTDILSQRQDRITTQLMFSLVTGGGGGVWERGELAGVSWEVILDPQLKILKSALHELCRLWQVLYLLLLPAVPKVSC